MSRDRYVLNVVVALLYWIHNRPVVALLLHVSEVVLGAHKRRRKTAHE